MGHHLGEGAHVSGHSLQFGAAAKYPRQLFAAVFVQAGGMTGEPASHRTRSGRQGGSGSLAGAAAAHVVAHCGVAAREAERFDLLMQDAGVAAAFGEALAQVGLERSERAGALLPLAVKQVTGAAARA